MRTDFRFTKVLKTAKLKGVPEINYFVVTQE
jgi:hypothetical protein